MFRFPVKKKKKADTHPLSLFAFEWVCFRPGLYPPGMKNKLWENTVKKNLSLFSFFPMAVFMSIIIIILLSLLSIVI